MRQIESLDRGIFAVIFTGNLRSTMYVLNLGQGWYTTGITCDDESPEHEGHPILSCVMLEVTMRTCTTVPDCQIETTRGRHLLVLR